jgi:hypothetical protein
MTTPSVLDQLHKFRYQTTTRETPWALIRSLNVAALRVHPPDLQQLSHLTSALSDCRLPATSTLFSKTDVSASHPTAVPPPPSGGPQPEAAMYFPSAVEVEQLLHVQQVVLQFALRSQSILKDQLLSKQQTAAVQSVTLQQYTTMTTRLEEAKQRLADAATEKQSLQTVLHNYEKQIVELKTKCQMLEKEGSYFRSLAEKSQAMMLIDHKSSSSLHPHHHHHHGGMVPSPVAVTAPGAPAPSSAPVATVAALEEEASKSNPTWKKGSHEKDDRKKRSKHHREDCGESTTDVTSNATSCSTTYSEDYARHHKKKHRSSSCCRRHAAPPAPAAPAGGGMDMQQFALMAALLQGRPLPSTSREEGGGAAWGDSAADKPQLVVRQLQREIQESNERMLDRMQQAIQRVEEGVERKISEANRHMVMRLEKDEQQRSSAMEGVASHLAEATKSTSLQIRALQDEVRQHSESQMTAIRQQLATLSVSAPTISMPATARSQSPSVLPPLAVSSPLQSNNNHNNININNNSVNLSNPNIYSDSHQPHQQLPGQLTLPSHQTRPKLDLSAISNTEAPTTHNTSTTAFGPRVVSATVSVTDERPPNDVEDVTSNDDDDDDDPYVPMHEQGALKLPCEHCRLRFPAKELQEHEQQCELRMLTCPNCRASIVARKFATHRCDLTSPVDLSSSLTRRSSSKMLQDTQDELQRLLEEEARDEARKAAAASKS